MASDGTNNSHGYGEPGTPSPTAAPAHAMARLAEVLGAAAQAAGAGPEAVPTPREMAELVWLARQLEEAERAGSAGGAAGSEAAGASVGRQEQPRAAEPPVPGPSAQQPGTPRVPLHLPESPRQPSAPHPATGPASPPVLAPAPPMLHHPLALQRALRPLKRRVPAPRARLLDERATADRIARLGAHPDVWLPVLRPAHDRWLRLALVHDTGPTMPVWRPLVRELHTTLAQSGIFRTVTLHPAGPDGHARQVPVPADGRTATLVVSDCMGPQWRPGPAGTLWYSTLRHWASRMPLAVVQPLPEHLWDTTALPAEPGLLSPPAAAAPTATLTFTPYDPDSAPRPRAAVPLPVLEPGAPWLANWASLLADPGGGRLPGAAAWLPTAPLGPAEFAPDLAAASAQELVLRFRATASPEAFRLAGHLALAVPSVPVMRLVQRTVDRDPRPQHLAEVILSGMLTAVPGPPGSYEFRPGVRELLLRTLPRTARGRTREFLARVGGLIDERAGLAAGEFRARTGGDDAFATVREETVRRLGGDPAEAVPGPDAGAGSPLFAGRYRLEGRRGPGRRVWQAVDTQSGERVVVHLYPEQGVPPERFLREADALQRIDSPHVLRLLDFGFQGETPYLVAEFTEGVTLAELLDGSGPDVSFPVLARLVCDGTAGLETLHTHGLVRGQRSWDGLLLRPDGTVMLSRVALGEESEGKSAGADLRGFRRLLRELAEQISAPPDFEDLLEEVRHGPFPTADRFRSARDDDGLRVEVLGPLSVSRDGKPVHITSPEARALLCLLVLRRDRRVTYAELAAGLWERPPGEEESRHRIETLARGLARVLGPGTIAAAKDGFALYAPAAYVDAFLCEMIPTLKARDPEGKRKMLTSALKLFKGDPLHRIPGPFAEATRTRLRALRQDIEAALAQAAPPATLRITADTDLATRPETRITLEYAVHQVLSRGALTAQQYEIRVRPDGYLVRIAPDATLLPVLVAALRWLPGHWSTLPAPPRLGVVFESEQPVGDTGALVTVVVPPSLYAAFTASSAASGPHRFHPLYGDSPHSPVAWYWPGPPTDRRDLVKGPSVTQDLGRLGIPAPGRTAIVHTRPEGPLTLLGPAAPHGGPVTYYEVDLTPHRATRRLTLPSSGKGDFTAAVELSWRVTDPVAFVRGETADVADRLFAHVAETAPRVTHRHSQRRAARAQRALRAELGRWPVPGLAVTCTITLAPEYAPPPEVRRPGGAPRHPSELLAEAETVLFGFDGPMVRLFTASSARTAALELLALAAEHRDPQEALTGRPLATAAARESLVHPLDVLRVFAREPLGPVLRRRLDELELRAVPDAAATHLAVPLIRTLRGSGRRVCVATDVCEQAVHRYLESYRLRLSGVHGRADDLNLLMPNPDCLRRALAEAAGPAVLIGTTVAELSAAERLGLDFVGLARNPTVEQDLRAAGCEVTVRSLAPLLEVARTL
ncbi:SAV_2336 N-terminal domain-related protein [Streptomyces sp. NPDC018693]|uniref:SAV_2336 N-terminal domain-related protein n=1 Tax=unclassified Streptomyces TaxID=2593676 RepID=UPI0037B29E7D